MVRYVRNKAGKVTHIEGSIDGKRHIFTTSEWRESVVRANKAHKNKR